MKPCIVSVALDVPLTRNFDFAWPIEWPAATDADIGRIVVVPFGSQSLVGLVTAVNQTSEVAPDKLRAIAAITIDIPALSRDVISLIRFCETYYHAPFGQIAINVIPPALRSATRT